MFVRYNIMEKI